MKLVVGLGNPGEEYKDTRHNLGASVLDEYLRKHGHPNWEKDKKSNSEIITIHDPRFTSNEQIILAKPQTFMNNSGQAVSKLVSYYKIKPEDVVVIHDELDLVLGKIKMRLGGAAAGHHGVESIINALNSDKFVRIRLGIGNLKSQSAERGGQHFNVDHFVIEPFLSQEKSKVKSMTKQTLKALDTLLEKGLDKAQNQFN